MSFTEYIFILLLMLTVVVYFCVPLKIRWTVLLFVSVLFFCTWGIEMLPFALASTFITWGTANIIEKWNVAFDNEVMANQELDRKEKTILRNELKQKCKYLLWGAVALILSVLIYVKAQSYLAGIPVLENIVVLFSKVYKKVAMFCLNIPILSFFVDYKDVYTDTSLYAFFVPLGISYYTMSLVAYMADVYWRKEKAEKNFFKLLLFVLYFPKILQGPISKHRNIRERLYEGSTFDYNRLCYGLQRILWGYLKKLVVADRLLLFVNPVFTDHFDYGGAMLFFAAIFSAFQLYCDFSGCMDIALGASQIFGIELEENFNRPFFAKSAAEFWNRWHKTLGQWFTDYIYMPIVISPNLIKVSGKIKNVFGKRAAKNFVSIVPIATVWIITGLWHGTGMNYIMWGVYWGLLMILSTVFSPEIKQVSKWIHLETESQWFQTFRQYRTFLLFVISRIFSTPSDITISFDIFRKMFFDLRPWEIIDGTFFEVGLNEDNFKVIVVALFVLWSVMKKQENGIVLREEIGKLPLLLRWSIYYMGLIILFIYGIYGPGFDAASFVYMNY